MNPLLRIAIGANTKLSEGLDRILPARLSVDGNSDFIRTFVKRYSRTDAIVYDVGGGKQPYYNAEEKRRLNCKVIGLDISREELQKAPSGTYDEIVVADICTFRGDGGADLVICQSLLEHVPNVESAIKAMASMLKPNGYLLAFVPCRNAAFARLNLLLPERLKCWILFAIFPATKRAQGFRGFYDRCIPGKLLGISRTKGLECAELKTYYKSSYFSFFFPFYAIWRFWTLIVYYSGATSLCETFAVALRKLR